MEPVKIEFQTNSEELSRQAKVIVGSILGVDTASGKTVKTMRTQISEQKALIRQLVSDMGQIQKQIEKTTPGLKQDDLTRRSKQVANAIVEEERALKELEKELNSLVAASTRLGTEKKNLTDRMSRLKMEGKQNSLEFQTLARKAADLERAIAGVNNQTRLLGKTDAGFRGFVSGISGIAGMASAGAGAMALFGGKSKDLEQVQTRLQALMAITIGLQQSYNALNRESAFRIAVVSNAKKLWAATQGILNTQLGIGVGLSKALMLSGIGVLIAGIAALVAVYQRWKKEQEETSRLQQETIRFRTEANKSVQGEISRIETLENVLRNANNTYKQRKSALEQLKSIMPSYNALLDKEGRFIEDNTGALKRYVEQLKNAALAKGAIDNLAKAQSAYNKWESDLENRKVPHSGHTYKEVLDTPDKERLENYYDRLIYERKIKKEEAKLKAEIARWEKEAEKYTKDDIIHTEENTKEWWELQQKNASARLAAMKDLEKGSAEWNKAVSDYNNAAKKLELWDIKTKDPGINEKASQARAAREQLQKEEVSGQKKLNALLLAAEEEGAAKRLQAAKDEYDAEINAISLKREQVKALMEKAKLDGKFTPGQQAHADGILSSLDAQVTSAGDKYTSAVKKIKTDSQSVLRQLWDEVYDTFRSELEREEKEINRSYDARKKTIIRETTDLGERQAGLRELQLNREKALDLARLADELRQLEAWKQIELQKIAITDNRLLSEKQKQKETLKIEQKAAQDSLALYKKMAALGVQGLENKIKELQVAIAGTGNRLEKISETDVGKLVDGFGEIGALVGEINSGLGQVLQKTGQMLSDSIQITGQWNSGLAGVGLFLLQTAQFVISNAKQAQADKAARQKEIEASYWEAVNYKIQKQIELVRELGQAVAQQSGQVIRDGIDKYLEKILSYKITIPASSWDSFALGIEAASKSGTEAGQRFWDNLLNAGKPGLKGANFVLSDLFKGMTPEEIISLKQVEGLWAVLPKDLQEYINGLEEAKQSQKEFTDALNESLTGTTQNKILDSILSGLREGKRGIPDFVDTFSGMMKEAMLESLRLQESEDVKKFYARYAELAKDGLTADEIRELQEMWEAIVTRAGETYRDMQRVAGMDFSNPAAGADENTLKGAYAKASQESIDLLAGQTGAQRIAVEAILELTRQRAEQERRAMDSFFALRDLDVRMAEDVRAIREAVGQILSDNRDYHQSIAGVKESVESVANSNATIAAAFSDVKTGNKIRTQIETE
jgi:hypothetical protein